MGAAAPPPAAAPTCYDGSGRFSPAGQGLAAAFSAEIAALPVDSMQARDYTGMVQIPGGTFTMGGDNEQARRDEFPRHPVSVAGFWMDATEVTNAEYARFVQATGYQTIAERSIDSNLLKSQLPPGTPLPPDLDLSPFALVFHSPTGTGPYTPADWWTMVKAADWQHPQGPELANPATFSTLPAVQIAWYDAAAYCKWKGKRLPTEAEWEYAARGGAEESTYPWGDAPVTAAKANFWQGDFPVHNEVLDGYARLAPVRSFAPNGYGLYDMAGNVWEWVADWYRADAYTAQAQATPAHNPYGPADSYDPDEPYTAKKTVRGGSFLCNDSYCSGYRVAARMKTSPDTGLEHTGCRCVR